MLQHLAQDENKQINVSLPNEFAPLDDITLSSVVSGIITLILVVAAVVFFFMLIIGGLKWILSGGDKAQTEGARNQITAALIGLVIVFGAFAISQVVSALFNVNIFELNLPSFVGDTTGSSDNGFTPTQ